MDETNTRMGDKPLDELEMFRMSAQHLIQLVEYYRGEADPRLGLAVQRAIKAHMAATEALGTQGEPASETENESALDEPQLSESEMSDTWVESPWAYLDIPSRSKGRLGPMPRFVPLVPKSTQNESDE